MFNFLGKSLVLVHTLLSVVAVVWAFLLFFQGRDFGFAEPRREPVAWDQKGEPTSWVRHPSEYDKSIAAAAAAAKTRDQLFPVVKPALDKIQATEPWLPKNNLEYRRLLKQLQEAPADEKLTVKRLKDGGFFVENPLGPPVPEDEVKGVSKSLKAYAVDLKELQDEVGKVEKEIQAIVNETKKLTAELTGTDELNKYVHPGLYQLIDREFKAQLQLKVEIDEIKPHSSKALEQARVLSARRFDLEATLQKLKAPPPKLEKKK